jgi:hypothetical protein
MNEAQAAELIYNVSAATGYTLQQLTEAIDVLKRMETKEIRAADTARRRTQGAKDGWEIRRGKQRSKE